MSDGDATLGRRIAGGAGYMVMARLAMKGIGVLKTIVLARLLLPEDFGLVAFAMTLVGAVEILSQFSFDMAIIANRTADRRHYDSVWTMSILRGLATALLLGGTALVAPELFGFEGLAAVMLALAAGSVIQGFLNPGSIDFRKHFVFRREFLLLTGPAVASLVVTLACALAWRDYWALVAGILTRNAVELALSYALSPYRPRFGLAVWREIFAFSKWLLVSNFTTFLNQRADIFILGSLTGAASVGTYNVSYQLSNAPTSEVAWPVMRAVFPGLSEVAGDRARLASLYLSILGFLAVLSLPAGVGIALVADRLVPVLLGDQWLAAIPLIQLLGLYGAVRSIGTITGSGFVALGRPQILGYMSVGALIVRIPLLIFAAMTWGVVGVAGALACMSVGVALTSHTLFARLAGLGIAGYAAALWRPMLAVAAMAGAVLALNAGLGASPPGGPVAALGLLIAAGAGSYVATLLGLWWLAGRPDGAERAVLAWVRSRRAARRARRGDANRAQA